MPLNRSPEFCLKITYRYLLKAGHVPGDTLVWPQEYNLIKLGRGLYSLQIRDVGQIHLESG